LAVPVLMAQQEWDDHDRSNKTLSTDLARNYLESCAPNAILFTFGDNDTYPLWYAQEVEGIRTDIRVINTSLLGIDWYMNQLRYKVNNSDSVDVLLTPAQIQGRNRDYVVFQPSNGITDSTVIDLNDMMKNYVASDDPSKIQRRNEEDFLNTFPTHKVSVPVDRNFVIANKTANATDNIVPQLQFDIPKNGLYKNDLAILAVIATNNWKRPIYFTSNYSELGFGKYLRQDGLSHRLVPVEGDEYNADFAYNVLMNKFKFGNADKKSVYYDEENRRHLLSIRNTFAELASYLAGKGRKEEARRLLAKVDAGISQENCPYGLISRGNLHNRASLMLADAAYRADDKALATKISTAVKKDLQQQITYYDGLRGNALEDMADEKRMAESYLQGLEQLKQVYNTPIPKAAIDTAKP
jgi:hypothetical protein